jgi:galactokinase
LQILKQHFSSAKTFRDIRPEDVISIKNHFPEKVFDRCLFVTQEIERTKKAAVLLKENNLKAFGMLMFEAHEGLSNLYEVSCAELDFLAEEAKKYNEIIGARMMGGGFGGCTINIIEKEKADTIIEKITSAYKNEFGIEAEVYKVHTSDGTQEIFL